MDTKFPKKIFVTASMDFDEDKPSGTELFVATKLDELTGEDDDTPVAVYELVKVGAVKRVVKVVFE